MNILITDDIEDNREGLARLIKQYDRKYASTSKVFYACNGQEAIDICAKEAIDLVFMDISMPVMNGLEATTVIHKEHPAMMIIVVSSESDEATKVKILDAGAEDYVMKPFSSSIMLSRLSNYQKLIDSRNSINFQSKAVNLFTHNVYSYQVKFFIRNKDELAQFWETLLVRLEFTQHIQKLHDLVRLIFRLGGYQLQKSFHCHVYLEEGKDYFYFTMDNMQLFTSGTIIEIIERYCSDAVYELKGDNISFALKLASRKDEIVDTSTPTKDKAVVPTPKKEQLHVYTDILDEEDLKEFETILQKLRTEITMMGSSSLEMDDIDNIHEYSKWLSGCLGRSTTTYQVSNALSLFADVLEEHAGEFLEKSDALASMVSSFINDLTLWKEMIFYTGAPSADFLDDSLLSSVEMIRAIFVVQTQEVEDLDDIFDF